MVIFARKLLWTVWSFWTVWSVCIFRQTSELSKLSKSRFETSKLSKHARGASATSRCVTSDSSSALTPSAATGYPRKGTKTRDHITYLEMRCLGQRRLLADLSEPASRARYPKCPKCPKWRNSRAVLDHNGAESAKSVWIDCGHDIIIRSRAVAVLQFQATCEF